MDVHAETIVMAVAEAGSAAAEAWKEIRSDEGHLLAELRRPGLARLRVCYEAGFRECSTAVYAKVQLSVAIGDAGREIVDYAQQAGAELIVIPSHGRTGLKRLLIGSVAERVVRLAHCGVLVLHS